MNLINIYLSVLLSSINSLGIPLIWHMIYMDLAQCVSCLLELFPYHSISTWILPCRWSISPNSPMKKHLITFEASQLETESDSSFYPGGKCHGGVFLLSLTSRNVRKPNTLWTSCFRVFSMGSLVWWEHGWKEISRKNMNMVLKCKKP